MLYFSNGVLIFYDGAEDIFCARLGRVYQIVLQIPILGATGGWVIPLAAIFNFLGNLAFVGAVGFVS